MRRETFLTAILILFCITVIYSAEKSNTFQEAKALFSKEQYQQAIPLFKKVIKENPKKQDEALYFLGMCQLKLQSYQSSVESFSQALKIREDDYFQALRGRADAYMAMKDYNQAIVDLQKILATTPNDIDTQYQIGLAYYYLGNYNESINYLKKVAEARPQDPQVHYFTGWVYYKLKQYDMTIRHFEIYVKLCPDCPEAAKIKEILRSLKG